MLEVNRNGDCTLMKSGGAPTKREYRGTVARETTRKRAGIIATREIVKRVTRTRLNIFVLPALVRYVIKSYISVLHRCASCMMGVMGVFKWLRNDIVQRGRNRRSLTPKIDELNNESYRNALQAFIDRRRDANESSGCIISPNSPDKERLEFFIKKNNENENKKRRNDKREKIVIPGIPNVHASDIFEIGWIAGTEDRYMELIFAEWQSTRVSLRRHTHPDCRNAVKADLQVLTEIRHSNVLLLMATTHTDDHGLVAIFEPVDCTLYNFVHEQGERVSVQGIAKCAGNLAGALKHAHMRGYVHGAISSHCVFLATCGTVKLGGWELADSLDNPKTIREYEERLRVEIYRWQAPEIFRGQETSKATDVYGLALLMWEMCTMNVPWNGLSRSEVERQYVQWERGVITDLYNFPPLLNKLLDAGLQLDVSKRTLDMSRMRRFLQTLEIQYEDAEPLYIETMTNNNNNNPIKLVLKTSPECSPLTGDSPSVKRYTTTQTPKRCSEKKAVESKVYQPRSLNLNLIDEPAKAQTQDILSFSRNETAPAEIFEQVRKTATVQRVNARNVNKACPTDKLSSVSKQRHSKIGESQKKLPRVLPETRNVTRTLDSTDDESPCNDPRVNIKKLRQTLANRREHFFYGSECSSQCSRTDDKTEGTISRMLMEVRSKDYEPHKPASHKTSIEPKQTKSSGQYNATPPRLAVHRSQLSPYSHVPSAVRDAVVQPKVLNTDSQSFFESSLWRKEKMICISKMRRGWGNDTTFCVSRDSEKPDAITIEKADSTKSNDTYTIPTKVTAANHLVISNECLTDISASTIPRGQSLQVLKDCLERATEIVLSTTSHADSSTIASTSSKSAETFDETTSNGHETLFENLYELKHEGTDSDIKSIERNGEVFFSTENKCHINDGNHEETTKYTVRQRSTIRDETTRGSFDISRLSSVVCESIAEISNENDNSSTDSKPDDRTVILSRSPLHPEVTVPEQLSTLELYDEIENENNEEHETSFALMIFSDKNRGCNSCNPKSNLPRRRSLPAALGQLRNLSNASLGKLPIRKVDLPDNTVEDIYIDDDFGDNLNVNMVLLDGDATTDDEDFLPDLEMSDSQDYF